MLAFLTDIGVKNLLRIGKHRKNCETALFKVGIVENVFCEKEGRKVEVVEVDEVDMRGCSHT